MQGQPNGYSVINIFEGSFTEEVMGAGKDIFEGVFKLAAFEERKKFDSTASAVHRKEYRYTYPSTQ